MTLYDALGVDRSAPKDEIRRAYRKAAIDLALLESATESTVRPMQVVAANFEKGYVVVEDGRQLPIIGWWDEDNVLVPTWRLATVFVASDGEDSYIGRVADWRMYTLH